MHYSALRSAARLATGMIMLLCACRTGAPATPDIGPSGQPAQLEITGAGDMGSSSVVYRVNNSDGGVVRYVNAAPEEVWKTLLATYNELKLPITKLDAARRTVSSTDARAPRRIGGKPLHNYLDCGNGISGPRVDSYDVAYTLVSVVAAAGDSTAVRSSLVAKARTRTGTSGPPVDCATTGRLEKRLAELVSLGLAR